MSPQAFKAARFLAHLPNAVCRGFSALQVRNLCGDGCALNLGRGLKLDAFVESP
jgi:hypothetical protein